MARYRPVTTFSSFWHKGDVFGRPTAEQKILLDKQYDEHLSCYLRFVGMQFSCFSLKRRCGIKRFYLTKSYLA